MTLGLNHITFAVREISRSVVFYEHVIGCSKVAVWDEGAYLRAGEAWLCLSRDVAAAADSRGDYTHTAFTFDAAGLAGFRERLRAAGGIEWKQNSSEGDSVYFLDPDGHRLEAHVGDLATRLASQHAAPYAGLEIHEPRAWQ